MFAEISRLFAMVFGLASVIGLTTYYSIDKDTVRVIRKSIRALNRQKYFRFEHLLYLVVKAGQRRTHLLALTVVSYLIHLFFTFLGV